VKEGEGVMKRERREKEVSEEGGRGVVKRKK
jgi:hypothetical protein